MSLKGMKLCLYKNAFKVKNCPTYKWEENIKVINLCIQTTDVKKEKNSFSSELSLIFFKAYYHFSFCSLLEIMKL